LSLLHSSDLLQAYSSAAGKPNIKQRDRGVFEERQMLRVSLCVLAILVLAGCKRRQEQTRVNHTGDHLARMVLTKADSPEYKFFDLDPGRG
jgi:hypothetical protein